jgi:subtilisin family serine protease
VAVLDTGIDLEHPDLDARDGVDCIERHTPAEDDHGHGTHVAGTVAAANEGAGIVGTSPGTTVYAVKVLNAGGFGRRAQVVCGIDWIAHHAGRLRIRVANMSFIGLGRDDRECGSRSGNAEHRAVCGLVAAGVVPVAAAGNAANDLRRNTPATYGEVLAVTAMADTDGEPGGLGPSCARTRDDRYARFSSFAAPRSPDAGHTVAAPGVCVSSTRIGGGHTLRLSGTSMASPHVAGTVANCLGHAASPGPCTGMTPAEIIQQIRADAAAKPRSYGFKGDPEHTPPPRRYHGFLVSNLDY